MWKVTLEAKGYNRISFEFEGLVSAGAFVDLADQHHDGKLEITIEKVSEEETEEE